MEGNFNELKQKVDAACDRAGRSPSEVLLLPVTKYAPPIAVEALIELGHRELGESTIQGVQARTEFLGEKAASIRWHMIGHLQRNKINKALEYCEVIHSIDSLKLANAIDKRLDGEREGLEFYLEINVGGEISKHGLRPEEGSSVLKEIRALPRLSKSLNGLMTIVPQTENPEGARPYFKKMRELNDRFQAEGLLREGAGLSMGMSGDFEIAIEEGATVVRLGRGLFRGLPYGKDLNH